MEQSYLSIMVHNKEIFFLVGPTCTGKSKIAIELLKKHPFEVVSMDASTIYKNLNIGTDKPRQEILQKYNHHMINIIEPDEIFNVNSYCKRVEDILDSIITKGKRPLIVGGTMMYFNRLLQGIDVLPERDTHERVFINYLIERYSLNSIHNCLKAIDALSFKRINSNDSQRIERALEVYLLTGRPMSSFFTDNQTLIDKYNSKIVFLLPQDRENYHRQIQLRTSKIFNDGLIDEVINLKKNYQINSKSQSMRAIGYRQTLEYLDGNISKTQLYDKCLYATRQLAKRQITWMKKFQADLQISIDHKTHVEIAKLIETNLHFT